MNRARLTLVVALALTVATQTARAGSLPPGFQDLPAFGGLGFTDAVSVRFAPDGHIFVAERAGLIKVLHDIDDTTPEISADLTTQVYNAWDRGLLGMAIDPGFPAQPYLYVLYTHDATVGGTAPLWNDGCPDPPGFTNQGCEVSSRLSRLELSGETVISETVLIEAWCQQFPSHSVGDLVFGSDGALFVTHGDGASFTFADEGQVLNPCGDPPREGGAMRCQDLETTGDPIDYHGALLRLDPVTGNAMPDNPLVGGAVADDDRVIAYGLRNPFRMTARPLTSEIWIADVGWGAFEEINVAPNPTDAVVENFGWPCYEGSATQSAYDSANIPICEALYTAGTAVSPYHEYPGGEPGGNSITGIAFATSGYYPTAYDGALFFADFSAGWLKVMMPDGGGDPDTGNIVTLCTNIAPVDLQIMPSGELIYVNYNRFGPTTVRRISYFPANAPPVAVATADVTSGTAPLTVQFTGSNSFDSDPGDTLQYDWDLDGDGQFDDSTLADPQYTYLLPGSFVATLRVTDDLGATGTAGIQISVNNSAPIPTITSPTASTTWRVGDVIPLVGSATDPESGPVPDEDLEWEVILHHCDPIPDCHEHFIESIPGTSSTTTTAVDHDYPSFLEIRLHASDQGATDWWDPEWTRRQRLTLDNAAHDEDLTDFPVMIRLDPIRTDYSEIGHDGEDLRFIDGDGTELSYEIESWDDQGESIIWVNVPQIDRLSSSDYIWMYYGNHDAIDSQDPPCVWNSGFGGVWHMDELAAAPRGGGLSNPGFDDAGGSLPPWVGFGSVFVRDFFPLTGTHHLKMYGQFSGGFNVSLVFQDLPASPGETWELDCATAHISGDAITGTSNYAEMLIEFRDSFDSLVGSTSSIVLDSSSPTDVWVDNAPIQLVAPAGTAVARALLVFAQPLGTEIGAVFYDDVSFQTVTAGTFDVLDSTAHGSHGSNSGATTTPGKLSGGLAFDGGDEVAMGNPLSLTLATEMTVEAWIKIADPNLNDFMRILSKKSAWDGPDGYEFEYNPDNNNLTVLSSGPDFGRATVEIDSSWHHVAATVSNTIARVYVDGIEQTSDAAADVLVAGSQPFYLGRHGGGGAFYNGDLDEVRVSNVARSPDWIAAQYSSMNDTFVTFGPSEDRGVLSGTASVQIQPETSIVTLATIPPGLDLAIYGTSDTTPFDTEAIVFGNTTVSAPTPQTIGGITYTFDSWSDGGAQSHTIVIPENDSTLTAVFVACGNGCPGDMNGDGAKDGLDIQGMADCMVTVGPGCGCADLDGVAGLDLTDVSVFVADLLSGSVCP